MADASVITVQVPVDLKSRIEIIAEEQGVSLNQLVVYMFTKEIFSFEAGNKISEYWKGYDKKEIIQGFDSVMSKIKDRKVPEWDQI